MTVWQLSDVMGKQAKPLMCRALNGAVAQKGAMPAGFQKQQPGSGFKLHKFCS
jgi:hypothetical protein